MSLFTNPVGYLWTHTTSVIYVKQKLKRQFVLCHAPKSLAPSPLFDLSGFKLHNSSLWKTLRMVQSQRKKDFIVIICYIAYNEICPLYLANPLGGAVSSNLGLGGMWTLGTANPLYKLNHSWHLDLNQGPLDLQSNALPRFKSYWFNILSMLYWYLAAQSPRMADSTDIVLAANHCPKEIIRIVLKYESLISVFETAVINVNQRSLWDRRDAGCLSRLWHAWLRLKHVALLL